MGKFLRLSSNLFLRLSWICQRSLLSPFQHHCNYSGVFDSFKCSWNTLSCFFCFFAFFCFSTEKENFGATCTWCHNWKVYIVSGVLTLSHAVLMLDVSRRPYFFYFAKTLHVLPQRYGLDTQIPDKESSWTLQLFPFSPKFCSYWLYTMNISS